MTLSRKADRWLSSSCIYARRFRRLKLDGLFIGGGAYPADSENANCRTPLYEKPTMNSAATVLFAFALLNYDDGDPKAPIDPAARYRELISRAREKSTNDVDDTTAIAIEFLRLRERIRHDRIGERGDEFLGYLRGRLRITPPQWWLNDFRNLVVRPSRRIVVRQNSAGHWKPNGDGDDDDEHWPWHYSGLTDIIVDANKMTLFDIDKSVMLLREDFAAAGKRTIWDNSLDNPDGIGLDGAVAATIRDDYFAVIFHCRETGPTGPGSVFYGDAKTGKPLWLASLCEVTQPAMYTGSWGRTFTEVVLDENRVLVYGTYGMGISLQLFDRKTGAIRFFFVPAHLEHINLDSTDDP